MIGSNTTTARVRLALEGQGQVVRGLQEVQAGIGGMRSAMASIAGGLSLGAAVGQLVQVQREMDVLNASMVTVTGSSRAASTEMEWIKRFAAQTPYQLNEVTGAFVKMKALGLDASERALRSYGNTASAMGKDLTQFIEAVADAATGEFERLKEFGIKAKKEGDSVAFNFQNVTTRVGNNASDIVEYLQKIGNTEFAGATEQRMLSLDGKIALLSKSWQDLALTVNQAGVGRLIETSVVGATAAISSLTATIRENKTELAVLAGGLGGAALVATLPKVGAGLMIVAGGVKALGLALAANPLVLALLGIGAAVGAAAAYSKVQSGTVESMARTVKELEALNARAAAEPWDAVLNANVEKRNQQIADLKKRMTELGRTARDAFALTDPRRTGEVTAEINYIAPAISEAAASGLDPKNPKGKPVKEALDRMAMYSAEVQGEFRQLVIDKEAQWAAEALKQELQSNEVESFFRQVEIEAEARWQAQQDRARSEAEEAAERLRAKEVAEWERANEQIAQSLTDSLMQGGRSFRDYLKDLFRTLVLRPILAPVAAAGASLFNPAQAGSAVSGGSGAGSAISMIGQLAGVSSALGTGMAAGFTNALLGSFSGSLAAAGSLIGTGTVAGVSAGVGMALGTVAPYAAAAYAVYKLLTDDTPGEQHRGGYYSSLGYSGLEGAARITASGPNSGQARDLIDRADPGLTGQVRQTADTLLADVGAMARAIGNQVALGLDLGFAANLNGQAGNANAFGYFGVSANGQMVNTYQNREMGSDVAKAYAMLTEDAANALAEVVLGGTGLVRTGESAYQALQRLSGSLQTVNQVLDTLGLQAYAVSLAGGDMASSLADLFGGLDAFTQASTAYYQAFYTEAERTATAERQLTAALQALGLQLPATREGFRALVEAQDLTTEAGRSTYATLVQLSPAFAEFTAALEQLGSTVADEVRRLRGLLTTDSSTSLAALQAQFATGTAMARAGDADALARLPELSQAIEAAAALQAVTAADVALMRGQLAASLSETLAMLGVKVPAFEVGTNYVPRTMLAQVHEGEAIVPRAYNPAAGGSAPGGEALAQRVDAMVAELQGLRAEVRSTAQHTAKTARILDRVARDGNAFVTVAEA